MASESTHESTRPTVSDTETCLICEPTGDSGTESATGSDGALPCYCRIDGMLNVLGKKYALQILGLLGAHGPLRYGEVEEKLQVASTSTLAERLNELTATDLIVRRSYDEIPPRVEYRLTPRGQEFMERIQPLLEWVSASDT